MTLADLRQTVDLLRERGRLREVHEAVSPAHEAAAVLALAGRRGEGAVYFHRIVGHETPVVGNVVCGREVLAWALGVPGVEVPEEFGRRLARPLDPRPTEEAPVLERSASDDLPLDRILPILTHHASDSAPYVTTGLVSAPDPDGGAVARGIHRMELRGARDLGVALINPPLAPLYSRYKARGQPMPVAVAVGVDPLTFASFALRSMPGMDKLAVAGGVRGSPVDVVPGPLTGVPVPARAEFLLEGDVDPADEREDGPLGEVGGYSLAFPATPTFRVRRVFHRSAPLYHALLPTGPEGDLLLATVAEAAAAPRVRPLFPFVREYHFVPGTFASSLVVRLARAPREQVRSLLLHLLTLGLVKKAVAVGEDVDPKDLRQVEWAVVTRCQPDRDAMILGDLKGAPIDPSCPAPLRTAKLAIDATGYDRLEGRPPARMAAEAVEKARTLLLERNAHG